MSNLIKFPMQKTRKTKSSRINLTTKIRKVQFEKNRFFISASIVSILVLATLANTNIFAPSTPSVMASRHSVRPVGRFIASINDLKMQRSEYDQNLLNELSVDRNTASFGLKPSLEDKLRYETLEGKYLMQFSKGNKIKSIEFTRLEDRSGEPKYLNNRAEFISKHKKLMPVVFDSTTRTHVKKSRLKTVENFDLIDGDNKVANVEFQLDAYGRFISMKVNKLRPF